MPYTDRVSGIIIYPIRHSEKPDTDLCVVFGDEGAIHEHTIDNVSFVRVQDILSGTVQARVRGTKATIKFKKPNMMVWLRRRGKTAYVEEFNKEDYVFVANYFVRFARDGKKHIAVLAVIKDLFFGK